MAPFQDRYTDVHHPLNSSYKPTPPLSSPQKRPLKPRRGVEVQLYSFFNLVAGFLTLHASRFMPGERDPVPIVQEAGCPAHSVSLYRLLRNINTATV